MRLVAFGEQMSGLPHIDPPTPCGFQNAGPSPRNPVCQRWQDLSGAVAFRDAVCVGPRAHHSTAPSFCKVPQHRERRARNERGFAAVLLRRIPIGR